jgi:hypothetical protein
MGNFDLNPMGLRHIAEIYQKLSRGYHFCVDDNRGDSNMVYSELVQNIDYYRTLFVMIGYELSDGSQNIYYFIPSKKGTITNVIGREMTLFMAILYDSLADEGKDPITAILETPFEKNNLPHLKIEQYRKIMKSIGVDGEKKILSIIRRFVRYGFLEVNDDTLRFRQSIRRFTKIFKECKDLEKETIEVENENG